MDNKKPAIIIDCDDSLLAGLLAEAVADLSCAGPVIRPDETGTGSAKPDDYILLCDFARGRTLVRDGGEKDSAPGDQAGGTGALPGKTCLAVMLLIRRDDPGDEAAALKDHIETAFGVGVRLFSPPVRLGVVRDEVRKSVNALFSGLGPSIRFGKYELHLDTARLYVIADKGAGEAVTVTEKERDLLVRLYRATGEAVGRQTLLRDIWGHQKELETHTLETHIYRLRQKIEDDPGQPRIVETVEDGYRLANIVAEEA